MAASTIPTQVPAAETSARLPKNTLPLEEQIRQRANQIWLENGSPVGSELFDWLEAEKEILEAQR